MIDVSEHPEGATLPIRAQPGAKRNALLGERAGALRVAVTAAPEDGKANAALVDFLAKTLDIRGSRFALLTGQTSRDKRFLVSGLTAAELSARLATLSIP